MDFLDWVCWLQLLLKGGQFGELFVEMVVCVILNIENIFVVIDVDVMKVVVDVIVKVWYIYVLGVGVNNFNVCNFIYLFDMVVDIIWIILCMGFVVIDDLVCVGFDDVFLVMICKFYCMDVVDVVEVVC